MPVGNDDNAPKLAVFPVTPTVQGDTEVYEAVPGLTLSKYSHSGGMSLPSSAGLGRDMCLTKSAWVSANYFARPLWACMWRWVHEAGDQGVVLPTSVN